MHAPTIVRAKSRLFILAIAAVLVLAVVVIIGTRSTGGGKVVATVHIVERDRAIDVDATQVPAGRVRLSVHNAGTMEHELVAFRTDVGEGAMPMVGMEVNEDVKAMVHMDPEAEHVMPGHNKTIVMDMTPGRYVLICNLPGHYGQGMHHVLTVT